MSKKPAKLRPDVAEVAFRVMQEAIGEAPKTLPPSERTEKSLEATKRGQLGGRSGGKARAGKLTQEQRAEISRLAAQARWRKAD